MATEKRLIDADSLANIIAHYALSNAYLNDTPLEVLKMVVDWMSELPYIELVRCKDCKHFYKYHSTEEFGCDFVDNYYAWGYTVTEDDFCSYGERRTDDN